jgi:uncharacterized LabA/DUF88 family protein
MAELTLEHRAAVLMDYQNLHHYLKNRAQAGLAPADAAMELLNALRERLAAEGVRLSVGYAYADFGGLDDHTRHVQRALYLHGIQPVYVPSTVHRNTTDLQLAIDALALRDGAPDVSTFVLVTGDRDYVPVVQALQAAGRRVLVVAFRDHLSSHLLQYTHAGQFLDAETLLSTESRAHLATQAAPAPAAEESDRFNEPRDLPHALHHDAMVVLERNFGRYEEVYLTPLLRKLSEEIGEVGGYDPKTLVADLEGAGAVRLERRKGMPYDYTVLLINRAHPAVMAVREEVHGEDADAAYDYGEEDDDLTADAYDYGDDLATDDVEGEEAAPHA